LVCSHGAPLPSRTEAIQRSQLTLPFIPVDKIAAAAGLTIAAAGLTDLHQDDDDDDASVHQDDDDDNDDDDASDDENDGPPKKKRKDTPDDENDGPPKKTTCTVRGCTKKISADDKGPYCKACDAVEDKTAFVLKGDPKRDDKGCPCRVSGCTKKISAFSKGPYCKACDALENKTAFVLKPDIGEPKPKRDDAGRPCTVRGCEKRISPTAKGPYCKACDAVKDKTAFVLKPDLDPDRNANGCTKHLDDDDAPDDDDDFPKKTPVRCQVSGCRKFRSVKAEGPYCVTCDAVKDKTAFVLKPDIGEPKRDDAGRRCRVSGCERKISAKAKGPYCKTCDAVKDKTAFVLKPYLDPDRNANGCIKCLDNGELCGDKVKGQGLCETHYTEAKVYCAASGCYVRFVPVSEDTILCNSCNAANDKSELILKVSAQSIDIESIAISPDLHELFQKALMQRKKELMEKASSSAEKENNTAQNESDDYEFEG
jgi:hypothetical protein